MMKRNFLVTHPKYFRFEKQKNLACKVHTLWVLNKSYLIEIIWIFMNKSNLAPDTKQTLDSLSDNGWTKPEAEN